MKVVIDIDEAVYGDWISCPSVNKGYIAPQSLSIRCMVDAVKNGTVLPKGHGRLIILDEAIVKENFTDFSFSTQKWISEVALSMAILKIAEADKGTENDL